MSGGPQVFLGATTFLCGCCAARFPAAARALGWGRAAWCARGRRPAREPSALRASLGASSRSPARPRHRPPAPRQVPSAPSTPVGPGVLIGCSARRPVVRPGLATASSISHAIPSDVFHGLKCDRWNSADSALVWGRAELELHAELREFPCPWSSLLLRGALLG